MIKLIDDYKYLVEFDEDDYGIIFSAKNSDFETEEDKKEYQAKFDKGLLCSFIVTKFSLCGACNNYHQIDCRASIHAANEDEALKVYLENHNH